MTAFQERLPNDFASLVRRIESLEREVQQARAARRLEAATIGRGGITVQGGAIILKDSSGNEIARMGAREDLLPEPDGDTQPGFILRRNDGSIAFTLDDPNPNEGGYRQLLKMQDQNGHIIFSEDYTSGWGISTPTFAIPLYNQLDPDVWPGSTSTTYTGLYMGLAPAWNPVIQVGARGITAVSGVTGSMRLTVNSIPVGDEVPLNFTDYTDHNWTIVVPDLQEGFAPGASAFISIEVKRTSATVGKVQATATWVYGQGSEALL